MPRPRTSEAAQRQSPRGSSCLRTSSSDSDPRPKTDKSPKLVEGRSNRGAQSNQNKLGTRIADLESQLGMAQQELRSLKDHLNTTEAAKKMALEKKPKKQPMICEAFEIEIGDKHSTPIVDQILVKKDDIIIAAASSDDLQQETDVFEVSIEKVTMEPKSELDLRTGEDEFKPKSVDLSAESLAELDQDNPLLHELALKNDEINLLKSSLSEKDLEVDFVHKENKSLRSQLDDKSLNLSSAQSQIDELTARLNEVMQELENSKSSAVKINHRLEATERAKVELESEMAKLRVQTEQWRKAADAAASVLAGGVEMNGRRISERCGSMDKGYANVYDRVGGFANYVGSPGLNDDGDDGLKRKGSGIRLLGELWKKKGQK